jgi:hypothetical protein
MRLWYGAGDESPPPIGLKSKGWWASVGLRVAAETQTARTSGNGNAEKEVALGKVQ